MSDAFAIPEEITVKNEVRPERYTNVTQQDTAIIQAKTERKRIVAALEEGTLSCLPGKDGFADTQAACNVVNNTVYQGSSQILLKDFQKRNGFPTAEYCTPDQIEKASNHTGKRAYIKQGSHGITLNFLVNGEQKSVRLFNIAQIQNQEPIRNYAGYLAENREKYLKERYGENYEPRTTTGVGATITCSSSNPDVYLGEYLAAVSLNGKFKASPEQAADFAAKTKEFIFSRNEAGHINPFNLSRLGSQASRHCKEILPEIQNTAPRKEPERQYSREESQSIGR